MCSLANNFKYLFLFYLFSLSICAKSATESFETAESHNIARIQKALKLGININAKDKDGRTELFNASFGDVSAVKFLIESKADINAKDRNGDTPLMAASWSGQIEIVKLLIAAKADINLQNKTGRTALMYASPMGSSNKMLDITRLLKAAGARDGFPLLTAADTGDIAEIKRLLELKTNVNTKNGDGNTALIVASWRGHTEIVNLLINAEANIDMKNQHGVTALMASSESDFQETPRRNNHIEIVKRLIQAKVNVNAKDMYGRSALIRAALTMGETEIVKLLIDAKADVNIQDQTGNTALMHTLISVWNNTSAMKLLIRATRPDFINVKGLKGDTALICATRYLRYGDNSAEIIKLLIQAGADVNASGEDDATALSHASQRGHTEIVELLIKAKADVNAKNKDGQTPLMMAVKDVIWADIVNLLIAAKADVNVKDRHGKTALMLVSTHSYADTKWGKSLDQTRNETIKVLKKAGAK